MQRYFKDTNLDLFELSNDDFTYYDTNDSKFVVEDGKYIIEVGYM